LLCSKVNQSHVLPGENQPPSIRPSTPIPHPTSSPTTPTVLPPEGGGDGGGGGGGGGWSPWQTPEFLNEVNAHRMQTQGNYNWGHTSNFATSMVSFFNSVNHGGEWDYQKGRENQSVQNDYKGNFNFGANGHDLNIPLPFLEWAAGRASSPGNTDAQGTLLTSPYGDTPAGNQAIKDGYNYAEYNPIAPAFP
jgi:hypothetical protein